MFSSYSSLPANYTDAKGDISHLLFRLGDSDLLNMEYGCDGSGSNIRKALRTFKKLGYRNARKVNYNSATAVSEIKNNRPVYIRGCATKKRKCVLWFICWSTYSSCHAWVLDGYVKRTQPVTVRNEYPCNYTYNYTYSYTRTLELVHNNFGWGSTPSGSGDANNDNGWYHKGLFNANNGPEESSNTFSKGNIENDFKHDNEIIINIK